MMIFKKALPRRTFLKGLGATVALPLLDSMTPAFAGALDTNGKPALRLGYVYVPNGIIRERWLPAKTGADFELTDVLKEAAAFRDQMVVLSGLDGGPQFVGGHPRGSGMYLTGVDPRKSLNELYDGISVDQVAAKAWAKDTQVDSLQLCIEDAAEIAGQAQGGYNAAYTNTISWRTATQPLAMEHRPRAIFERLFGDVDGNNPEARKARIARDRSVLDFVSSESSRMMADLGSSDRSKVGEFMESLRDVERRVQMAEKDSGAASTASVERPVGIPATYEEHVNLMYDLLLLAYKADITRVSSFMLAREYSELVYNMIGHTEPHHPLTHHRGVEWRIKQAGEVNVYHMKVFAQFLKKMRDTKEGDGNLLDHSILVYGAGMGDADIHNQWNLPVAMFGGGNGLIKKGGLHVQYAKGTPFANFHVALLNLMGVPTQSLGNSTGPADLSAFA